MVATRFRDLAGPTSSGSDRTAVRALQREDLQRSASGAMLLRGGCVLSQDPAIGNIAPGDILVRDGKIVEVGAGLRAPDDAVIVDASDTIVIPGFVDAHVHAWEGQLRGTAPVLDFPAYMQYTRGGYAPLYDPDDVYLGTLMSALVALDAGTTTMIDNAYNNPTPEHADAAVEALWDSGIRGVHASGSMSHGADDPRWPRDILRLRDRYFGSEDQRLTFRLYDMAPEESLWRFARDEGLWVSTEIGSHVPDLEGLLGRMRDLGLLTDRHAFNHVYDLTPQTWALVADAGIAVNVCPRSDAAFGLGPGFPELDAALSRGIRPGISGDNELSYGLSMFTEMQILLSGHRGRTFEAVRGPDEGSRGRHLRPEEVLEFATMGGAANAGLDHRIGSLSPGKDADIVLVRTSDLNVAPVSNAVATITSFAHAGNVDTVFVGGRVVKLAGRMVDSDLDAVRAAVESSRDRLMAARGLRPDRLAPQGASPLRT